MLFYIRKEGFLPEVKSNQVKSSFYFECTEVVFYSEDLILITSELFTLQRCMMFDQNRKFLAAAWSTANFFKKSLIKNPWQRGVINRKLFQKKFDQKPLAARRDQPQTFEKSLIKNPWQRGVINRKLLRKV
jgi:hypothetical protein